ncbi:MAG: RluA family pseudouridine synthase [Thiotrichales bacterium]
MISDLFQPFAPEGLLLPERFPSPFALQPHPLAVVAARALQQRLGKTLLAGHDFFAPGGGRQFAVLVVRLQSGMLGYLCAISNWPRSQPASSGIVTKNSSGESEPWWTNPAGEQRGQSSFYAEPVSPDAESCAPAILLDFANRHGLENIALTEFWWGSPPPDRVRRHQHFYPSARSACGPLLEFLLQGIEVEPRPEPRVLAASDELDIVYEDRYLLLLNKPGGLLSVPGKTVTDSVLGRLRRKFPDATGPLLLHRLDLGTSGLLLAAKTTEIHKSLQHQFMQRRIKKTYVAVLDGELRKKEGSIDLPLRVDLMDRPHQMVCERWGKPARTRWTLAAVDHGRSLVYFYPETGRTHQLRVHAAHAYGLGLPIVGDELYGQPAERLMLHASELEFWHPGNEHPLKVLCPPPFGL